MVDYSPWWPADASGVRLGGSSGSWKGISYMNAAPAEPIRERSLIRPVFATAFAFFMWACLATFDVGDWPSPHQFPHNQPTENACGRAGAFLAYQSFYYLGDGVYPLALFGSLAALTWLVRGNVTNILQRTVGLALLVACIATAVDMIAKGRPAALPEGAGGVLGSALGRVVEDNFNSLGAVVVLGYALIVGLVLTVEGWVLRAPAAMAHVGRASRGALAAARNAAAVAAASIPRPALVPASSAKPGRKADLGAADDAASKGKKRKSTVEEGPAVAVGDAEEEEEVDEVLEATDAEEDSEEIDCQDENEDEDEVDDDCEYEAEDEDEDDEADPESPAISPMIIKHFNKKPTVVADEAYPREIEDWVFPPLSLLEDAEYNFTAQQESVVRSKAKILERTLEEFRIQARVVEIDTGPVITMYELALAPGIKVSRIASLSNDIARALKAPAVRVVAPIPGKNTVGIEVPNVDKEKVRFKELITIMGKKAHEMSLPIFIGKDASGSPLVGDLAKMPHLLIAGTTGSGKSVCINSIIASFLMTKQPDCCKLILVDPKMVEMSQFKEVPHLMCPIVTDMNRAETILEWAVTKMEERYEILSEGGVRNITAFNALGKDEVYRRFQAETETEQKRIQTHLPYVVIIIDELADLMMTSAKEVEHHLSRLAQKSRAVGIHIVVATQRPEAKVVTGLIKSNLPCRIAFRVASRMDSRIVLDQNGAEVLMGQGDMLFLPPGSHKLMRAQGTYLEDHELHNVIDFFKDRAPPDFHPELVQLQSTKLDGASERDPLFNDGVRLVLESRRGSVSLLQRKLTIGYSRASRLIEQMADAGIVGIYKGSQAREVNMTVAEWDALQAQLAKEMTEEYEADQDDEVPELTDDHDVFH